MIRISAGINDGHNAVTGKVRGSARVTQANDASCSLRGVIAGNRAAKECDQCAPGQGIQNAGAGLGKRRLRQATQFRQGGELVRFKLTTSKSDSTSVSMPGTSAEAEVTSITQLTPS